MTEMLNSSANVTEIIEKKVLCVGEVLWDLLPTGAKVGGAPLNVALHLKKFGFKTCFAGRVGSDPLGNRLVEFINSNGLSTSLLQLDQEKPTSTVIVNLGGQNQVTYEIVDNVAWDGFELTEELIKVAEESDVIIYGTLASRHSKTRDTIMGIFKNGATKLIDVNLRNPYDKPEVVEKLLMEAGIAKLNDDELRTIGSWHNRKSNEKDITKWFTEKYGCSLVCVTRGSKGAMIYDGDSFYEHNGYKVQVVDTVGSGDAFLAGFLAKYLTGAPINEALDFACATGAFVATREGGTPDYQKEDITRIISKQTNNR